MRGSRFLIFELFFPDFFKNFKVPLLGNGGVHSNGLKSLQLDFSMNLPVKFHQNRLTPLASRVVHYIQTNRQAGRRHGWSLHNCILVKQFLTDRAEIF